MLMDVPLSPTLQVIVGVYGCTKSPAQLGMQALKSPKSNEIGMVALDKIPIPNYTRSVRQWQVLYI